MSEATTSEVTPETTPEETPEPETTPEPEKQETLAEALDRIAHEVPSGGAGDPVGSVTEPETIVSAMEENQRDALEAFAADKAATAIYGRIAERIATVRQYILRPNGHPDWNGSTALYKWFYRVSVTESWNAAGADKASQTRMRNAIAQQVRRIYLPAVVAAWTLENGTKSTIEEDPETGDKAIVEVPLTEEDAEAHKAAILSEYASADLNHPVLSEKSGGGGDGGGDGGVQNAAKILSNATGIVSGLFDKVPARYLALTLDIFSSKYADYLLVPENRAQDPAGAALAWGRVARRAALLAKYLDGKATEEDLSTLAALQYDEAKHGKL